MNKRWAMLILASGLTGARANAEVTGHVRVRGALPALAARAVSRDKVACGKSQPDESVVAGPGGVLANVVISWAGAPSTALPEDAATAGLIDQIGCRFVPHVLAVRAGQKLRLGNADHVLHNVHAWTGEQTVFNLAFPMRNQEHAVALRHPGTLELRCDAGHDWMKAWVVVFDHPFFAVSGTDGSFSMPSLPAGAQKLRAWHERFGTQDIDVVVKRDGSGNAEIMFEP